MKFNQEPLSRSQQIGYGVAGLIGTMVFAELVLRSGLTSKPGLPMPSSVISGVGELASDAVFWEAVAFTLQEWLLGLSVATVVGVLLGGLMGAFTKVFVAFELPVEVFRVLPSVAIGPILVLILGAGMLPLALTVALASVWPILLNTMYGVRGTDATAVQTARSLGLGSLGLLARVKVPYSLPFAFTGIRVAASIGLIVAVSAELLIGNGQGIGGYILVNSANATNLDLVYAATVVAGILGVAISGILTMLDHNLFGWKKGLAQ